MDRGGSASYYIADGLGSTRALTNAAGTVTDTDSYDAFGSLAASAGSTVNPFLFNGQQYDSATGLYYLRARYYAPGLGRFISQDPFGGDPEIPVSLHRYLYASDDPINNVDPSGMDDLGEVSLSESIGQYLDSFSTSVFVRAGLFAARNPALVRLALYGQGALVLYNYISDPDTVQLAAATGGLSADIQLIDDVASDTSRAFTIFKDLDEYNRATGIVARLTQDSLDKGSPPSIDPAGWDQMKELTSRPARGHLLARKLGGPGNLKENLVPLYQEYANSPEMRGVESQVINAIKDQNMTVYYRVTPIYDDSNPIPLGVHIEAEGSNIDGQILTINQTIRNKPK